MLAYGEKIDQNSYKPEHITRFRKNMYYLFPLLGSCQGIPNFEVINYLEKGN